MIALAWFGGGVVVGALGLLVLQWLAEVIAFRSWWGP